MHPPFVCVEIPSHPMSLQRVLETARKMGVPVIVTDSAGLDPIVILPLEQFEAMAGESKFSAEGGEGLKVKSQKSR